MSVTCQLSYSNNSTILQSHYSILCSYSYSLQSYYHLKTRLPRQHSNTIIILLVVQISHTLTSLLYLGMNCAVTWQATHQLHNLCQDNCQQWACKVLSQALTAEQFQSVSSRVSASWNANFSMYASWWRSYNPKYTRQNHSMSLKFPPPSHLAQTFVISTIHPYTLVRVSTTHWITSMSSMLSCYPSNCVKVIYQAPNPLINPYHSTPSFAKPCTSEAQIDF